MAEKFHTRFGLEISMEEAQKRLVNRAYNLVFSTHLWGHRITGEQDRIEREVLTTLGRSFRQTSSLDDHIRDDFYANLQALEAYYAAVPSYEKEEVGKLILRILEESELDLGVRWEVGRFIPSGAEFLDETLVRDNLRWLRDPKYKDVLSPFSKALGHYLHSRARPELLADVITDMYEAVEALAKIITGRLNKDLSANCELFLAEVKASDEYKKILRLYIEYANRFRHAVHEKRPRPDVSFKEVESFMYLTGLFIRLAIPGTSSV